MKNLIDNFSSLFDQALIKPWLALGKGPSFSKLANYDLQNFYKVAINHVARECEVDLCHIIDVEVLDDCGEQIYKNAKFVVLPWYPHENMKVGTKNLEQRLPSNKWLEKLESENRLFWYDLSTAQAKNGHYESVKVEFFSSEAVLGLLALCGVKQIRSLGIDGGLSYSKEFFNLRNRTKLVNGQASFSPQFIKFGEIITKYNLNYGPLDIDLPIKVFVGASEFEYLPTKILEYSLRKNSSISIELSPLNNNDIFIPKPKDKNNYAKTAFSFQRFLIPQLCNFESRAIYLDSDMLVLDNISKIWQNIEFLDKELVYINSANNVQELSKFSVMLLNCQKLNWDISSIVEDLDEGKYTYQALMHDLCIEPKAFAGIHSSWNSIDTQKIDEISLLHYTDLNKQPWLSRTHPLSWLWIKYLKEAIEARYIDLKDLENEINKLHVRPSLYKQVVEDVDTFDPRLSGVDADFLPPHKNSAKQRKGNEVSVNFRDKVLNLFKKYNAK